MAAAARIAAANADIAARLQALEQAQPGGQAPAGPSVTRPDFFSGTRNEDVRRWLDKFQLHREANGWNDARARSMMAVCLTGPAENWFHAQAEDQVDTIEHLTAALRAGFAPVDDSLALRDRLMSRRQGTSESVEAYGAEILELCRHLDRNMPGREKCAYLLHGLREPLKEHVLTEHPGADNVAQVLQTARIKEQAMRSTATQPNGVHAVAFDAGELALQEIAQDLRRVLNRMDSIAERVSALERRSRDPPPPSDTQYGRDRRGQSSAWGAHGSSGDVGWTRGPPSPAGPGARGQPQYNTNPYNGRPGGDNSRSAARPLNQ